MAAAGTLIASDAAGDPLPANPLLVRGQHVTVRATGFVPDEDIGATLYSTPRVMSGSVASDGGLVSYPFTVPRDLALGAHTLQLRGSALTVAFPFRVGTASSAASGQGGTATASGSGSALPFTGFDSRTVALLGLVLSWAGVMITLGVPLPATRRRAARHAAAGPRHAR